MAVYFVTGKLGSGKTLASVGRIRDRLAAGAPVATNLDLNLVAMCGPRAKTPVVYRLPDKPGLDDFLAIGKGNETYDESKNGLVVLDECGTWFNSRTWGDKERQAIINWFLHARKLGWDIIFIVQNIGIVDKQARLTLAEHVVYCRRLDKLTIPFVSTISKIITGKAITFPKLHFAAVKYGDQINAMRVDMWWYFGHDLYDAYDTKQGFSDFYPHTTHQLLSPWLTRGRYMVPMNWSNFMRMTKIYWKQFNRPVVAAFFFAVGVAAAIYFREAPPPVVVESLAAAEHQPETEPEEKGAPPVAPFPPVAPSRPVHDRYSQYVITGHMTLSGRDSYFIRSPEGVVTPLDAASRGNLDVMPRNNCHVRVISVSDVQDFADIYHPGCVPLDVKPAVVGAIDVIPARPVARHVTQQVYIPADTAPQKISMHEVVKSFE